MKMPLEKQEMRWDLDGGDHKLAGGVHIYILTVFHTDLLYRQIHIPFLSWCRSFRRPHQLCHWSDRNQDASVHGVTKQTGFNSNSLGDFLLS